MGVKFDSKKYMLIILAGIIALGFFITGCSDDNSDNNRGLTMEEKLEDFEYLYSFIAEGYPFLRVNERVNGVHWLQEKDNFRTRIQNTNSDYGFMDEINNILRKLNDFHTHTLTEDMYPYFYKVYSELPDEAGYKPIVEILENETVVNRYKFEEQSVESAKLFEHQQSYLRNNPACKTDIIIPDKVGYLRIYEMRAERIEHDGIIIRNFLEEVKDYEKLIIDIRGNGGGNDHYWMENVIEPLANEVVTLENYVFVRNDNLKEIYESLGYVLYPISNLDENTLSSFPEEVAIDYNYYGILTKTINPIEPVGFIGKIYLLVDKDVYSSADSLAAVCKGSGFATLVGGSTGGGGGGNGAGPLLSSLPNSGILFRFSGYLLLNSEGEIHEEVKTMPDIEIDATIGTSYSNDNAIQFIINE